VLVGLQMGDTAVVAVRVKVHPSGLTAGAVK
jgi:hypothetical protein